jgi:hypothetical protein
MTVSSAKSSAGQLSPNYVINSAFDIWQRGTSAAMGVNNYIADRWGMNRGSYAAGATVSRQPASDLVGIVGVDYAARVQRNSGNSGTDSVGIYQSFESVNVTPFRGQVVTFSFYARAGSNFSPVSSSLNAIVYASTGTTDGNLNTTTGLSVPFNRNGAITTTWARYSTTGFISPSAKQLHLTFSYTPTGTAGADDWFEVTGVQLELGPVATPFRRNANSIQGELAACQRYYQSTFTGSGKWYSTTVAQCYGVFPVQMRVAPTLGTTISGAVDEIGVSERAITGITSSGMRNVGGFIAITTATATANAIAGVYGINVQLSAEL